MNYLVTVDRFFRDTPGGAYRIAWELAQAMRERGHRVALLCASRLGDAPPGAADIEGIRVVRYLPVPTAPLSPFRWRNNVYAAAAAFAEHLADVAWDVVHAHTLSGAVACTQSGWPGDLLYTVHSPVVLEQRINWSNGTLPGAVKRLAGTWILQRDERRVLLAARRVHVLSAYTAECLRRFHGLAIATKAQVIPWWSRAHPLPISRHTARRQLGCPSDRPLLLSIRRMVPRMGLRLLIEAAEPLAREHEFSLVLAGEGPERDELMKRVSGGPLSGRVIFPGRLSEVQLHQAYCAADAFVLPTQALECFGIIILEALASGIPVIASDAGAIPEIMDRVLPGWTFKAGDVGGLRVRLQAFLSGSLKPPSAERLELFARDNYGRDRLLESYTQFVEGR